MIMGIFDRGRRATVDEPVAQPSSTIKLPEVGDKVWWAAKQIGAVITEAMTDGSYVFQGGPTIKNKKGRQVPRWSVAATFRTEGEIRRLAEQLAPPGTSGEDREKLFKKLWRKTDRWDPELGMWIVGQGPTPKKVRGQQIIYPKPADLSGQAQGSFAVEG